METINQEETAKPPEVKAFEKPVIPHVELTDKQKKSIIEHICNVDDGFYEENEDFWQDITPEMYRSYCDAADRFVDELKQKLNGEINV